MDISHSRSLFSNIDKCLNEINLNIGDIECIGVGIGPGSFTGIRIAVTTARMLAQLLKIPLVGIFTHDIFANSISVNNDENILVAFDAKKTRVFGALYDKSANTNLLKILVSPGDHSIEHLLKNANKEKKLITIGDGSEKYMDYILSQYNDVTHIKNFMPNYSQLCKLINDTYNSDPNRYTDFSKTVPFYARKSDAEIAKSSEQ